MQTADCAAAAAGLNYLEASMLDSSERCMRSQPYIIAIAAYIYNFLIGSHAVTSSRRIVVSGSY